MVSIPDFTSFLKGRALKLKAKDQGGMNLAKCRPVLIHSLLGRVEVSSLLLYLTRGKGGSYVEENIIQGHYIFYAHCHKDNRVLPAVPSNKTEL